jgi:transposase
MKRTPKRAAAETRTGEGALARPLIDDTLWEHLEALLPLPRPRRFSHPGRRPLSARHVITGILFVLKMGIPWQDLPCELGCGSGMSCLRYLRAWRRSGVWQRVAEVLRQSLPWADEVDWARAEDGHRSRDKPTPSCNDHPHPVECDTDPPLGR